MYIHRLKLFNAQVMGEDWETPARIMELQDALKNYYVVWFYLWNFDPSPLVLLTVLTDNNYGSQLGEDEKGRVRYVTLNIITKVLEPDNITRQVQIQAA